MALIGRLQDDSVETECCQRAVIITRIIENFHRSEMERTEIAEIEIKLSCEISLFLYRQRMRIFIRISFVIEMKPRTQIRVAFRKCQPFILHIILRK